MISYFKIFILSDCKIQSLLKYFDNIDFNHIYRKHNLYADSLANHALIEYFNNSKS